MRSIQVVARGRAEFIDTDKPQVSPGHVVVQPSHLSLCGSDIRMLYHSSDSCYPFPPGTTGHEMVGHVVEVGDADSNFRIGDRVLALAPGHRAMCEYYLAPYELVIPLPPGLPLETLLQAQQLGTVIYAAQRLPNLVGKNAVVIGQGSAGLWFNHVLRGLGARRVVAVDIDANRLKRSTAFGASHVIHNAEVSACQQLTEILAGQLADVVIEAAGEIDAINLAVELVRQYGEILFFGYPRGQIIPFDFEQFFHKCCRATTIVGATAEANQESTRMALEWIAQGRVDADSLITHRVPFDEVLDAYELHRSRGDGTLKIVIEMPSAAG